MEFPPEKFCPIDPDFIDLLTQFLLDSGPPLPESFRERYPMFCAVFAAARSAERPSRDDSDQECLELQLDDLTPLSQFNPTFREGLFPW
jgi:hypothetical protein